ncbi:DUF2799 domain-containing protein [Brevundimonas sp.]|uniref:DUF2799 domain-containing protein n=1 Tax=Brevundimonas sp. TaxID=1871086 RepID=UPI0025F68458|nr:DUF2799 domain-containing protein [Brevundimonas sp.]
MRIAPFIAIAASAALLNGCATLSEEQCLVGDWYGIGVSDGASGYAMSRIDDHTEACARHGVSPNMTAYAEGRARGLLSYCTPQVGFREGREGDGYAHVCPADLEPDFLAAYSDGRLVHAAITAVNAANSDLYRYQQQARDIETQIRNEEAALGAEGLTDEQRRVIRERIRRLRDDRDRALSFARDAEWQARDAQREVDMLRARFAAYYGSS